MPQAPNAGENIQLFPLDSRTQALIDVYRIYRDVEKTFHGKDSTKIQAFATLFTDTYKVYAGVKVRETTNKNLKKESFFPLSNFHAASFLIIY